MVSAVLTYFMLIFFHHWLSFCNDLPPPYCVQYEALELNPKYTLCISLSTLTHTFRELRIHIQYMYPERTIKKLTSTSPADKWPPEVLDNVLWLDHISSHAKESPMNEVPCLTLGGYLALYYHIYYQKYCRHIYFKMFKSLFDENLKEIKSPITSLQHVQIEKGPHFILQKFEKKQNRLKLL
ncbi:hypothetical protein FF38_02637 [Lucilia cuprina]|uniref:Uncharacterized protein n=1 Tax=Lucilia cuprina TaxID=7375 RepID=A0A0L0C4J7_LUCCU|nr:hypothetical protein FF38_02637 [Lucilia cuprina]